MALNINRLLNKKTWTGKEIGKALIASFAHDIKNKGNQDAKPLFTQEDFNRMTRSLTTENQIAAYLVYENMYSGCIDSFNRGESYTQQFYHGYYRLLIELQRVMQADDALKAVEEYPLILSKSQYERIQEAAKEKKRGEKTTFNDVLFEYLEYCIDYEDNAPDAIKKALISCREEKVTNKRILANYNTDMGEGYYILPDGTESRNCTTEQWQQATKKAYIKEHDLPEDITEQQLNEYMFNYNSSRNLQVVELLFKGEEALLDYAKKHNLDTKELEKTGLQDFIENILDTQAYFIEGHIADLLIPGSLERGDYCKWVTLEEAPEGITKYDVIAESVLLLRYSGGYAEDIPEKKQLEEFVEDYPLLYKALNSELKKLLNIKGRTAANKTYTKGELADLGVPNYIQQTELTDTDIIDYYCSEDTEDNIQKRKRAAFKGIAILSGESNHNNIDHNTGDYIEPVNPYAELMSLDSMGVEEAMQIESYITILISPAIRYLLAYNTFLDILSANYDVPDIEAGKIDLDRLEDKIDAFNKLLYVAFESMSGSRKEKRRKRKLLQDYFAPIDWSSLKPAEENVNKVSEQLENLGYSREAAASLKVFDNYINALMGRG